MFILGNNVYRPVALSPRDKAKKRELQLQDKFEYSREEYDETWGDTPPHDLIDNIIYEVQDGMFTDREGKNRIVDPNDLSALSEEQNARLYDLMDEHFWEVYSEEDIKKRAKQHVPEELDERFTKAYEAYEAASKEHGDSSEVTRQLEAELDTIEEEFNEEVEPNEGDAWYTAKDELDHEHWEEHVENVVAKNFMTESTLRQFLEQRLEELKRLASSGGDIYRGVVMESGKDPTTNRGLGMYWTDKKELARPFLKEMNRMEGWHDPVVIRYRARLDGLENLNLKETLDANAWAFANEGYDTDKNEVRFLEYAPIYVHEAELLDTDPYSPDYSAEAVKSYPIEEMRRA